MSSTIRTAKRSSVKESPTVYWMPRPSSETSEDSSATVTPKHIREWLMSSVEDSHASRSAQKESVLENWTQETCGRQPVMYFEQYSQNGHSLKMYQGCLFQDTSIELSETFPRSGMCLDGDVYRLPKLGPGISETDCGFWPTPKRQDGMTNLTNAQLKRDTLSLAVIVQMYPTGNKGDINEFSINKADRLSKLNPSWVEWLMGWPIGWTSLEPLTECKTLALSVEPNIPRTTKVRENRCSRIKALGNGQVPQCAAMAWRLLTESREGKGEQRNGSA